jgi:hypothetical protein
MTSKQLKTKPTKIADTTTVIPDGPGKTFAHFAAPSLEGNNIVFYGKSTHDYICEGLYGSFDGGALVKISDILTTIPDLNGPPSDNEFAGYIARAYEPFYQPQELMPCTYSLNHSRPLILDGTVVFFAANWQMNISGIFAFDLKTSTYRTLALDSQGYFKDANLEQPNAALNSIYFGSVGKSTAAKPLKPGIYSVPLSGAGTLPDGQLVLDMNTAKTADGLQLISVGNPHLVPLLPTSSIILYANYDALVSKCSIFLYALENGQVTLSRLIKEGDIIGGHTISNSWNNSELSLVNQYLAFRCLDTENNHVLIGIDFDGGPGPLTYISADNAQIPGGGGTFNGDSFAMPPATDGVNVVFTGCYYDSDQNMQSGLFVWNKRTNSGRRLLDSTQTLDGQLIANFELHSNSASEGKVAVKVLFQGNVMPAAIYLVDLE